MLTLYATCTDPDDPVGTDTGEQFDTLAEASVHARARGLVVVEHVYEWQEAIPVEGMDYRDDPEQRDRYEEATQMPDPDDDDHQAQAECSECGHLHWHPATRRYSPCPLAAEGCPCRLDDTR